MSIRHFFNKSIVIKRLSSVSGYKKKFVSTGTIDAHLQKITDESTFQIYGTLGATHKAWCDVDSDIKEGDKLSWHFYAPNVHDFVWAADPNYTHDIVKTALGIQSIK